MFRRKRTTRGTSIGTAVALALLGASLGCESGTTTDGGVQLDSEVVAQQRHQLQTAKTNKGLHQDALKRVKEDVRWEDPEQHEGLEFAADSTGMLIAEQEEIIQRTQRTLDEIDRDGDDKE